MRVPQCPTQPRAALRAGRFSWQTTNTLLAARGVAVAFEADGEEDSSQQTLTFGQRAAGVVISNAADRHSFFRARRLQRCTEL